MQTATMAVKGISLGLFIALRLTLIFFSVTAEALHVLLKVG